MERRTALQLLVDMLFPPRCVFCDDAIYPNRGVCNHCAKDVQVSHTIRRMKAGEGGDTVCCLTPYRYDGKVRDSLIRFKFHNHQEYASYYGQKIAEQLCMHVRADCMEFVTAVPLSKRRMREREYNQSELVARAIAKHLDIPYVESLRKERENRIQHELPREDRAKNVRGVYSALAGAPIRGKCILLVDDIVTTGATLGECAHILLQAGAAQVICTAVADVP